jgi:hypothetical protein
VLLQWLFFRVHLVMVFAYWREKYTDVWVQVKTTVG